jgi:ATP-dependent DNA helicase RecG
MPPATDFSTLDRPVQFLKGVGPKWGEALQRMGILTARDLLHHVPRRYDDASTVQPIAKLEVGMDATAVGRVRSKGVIPTRSGLRIFQAVLQDASGLITCAWPGQPWLENKIREGDVLLVTGPVRFFHGRQIQPREFTMLSRGATELPSELAARGTIFTSYPASEGVPQWVLRGIFERNLDGMLKQVAGEESLPPDVLEGMALPSSAEAFRSLHRPRSLADAETGRRRLAYEELFFHQIVQAQARWRQTRARPGIQFRRTNALIRPLHESLPFTLTEAQARVLREIYADMTSTRRMNRLVQGDVGSGKTVVALFAMLLAAENDYQAALMAPTEILAEQHARTLRGLVAKLGLEVVLLTGRMGAAERRRTLAQVASGEAPLVVGTHALIQEGVSFARLGLVVVDEQHRFGVRQRMALTRESSAGRRGAEPDVLIMSATPIPRSMAMTVYGDLDLSVLDELPPGRKPVRTLLRYPSKRDEVYQFVDVELAAGRQGFIVYPLVEESEKVDLLAATQEFDRLGKEVFTTRRVGLLHGQLPGDEKDRVMRAFLAHEIDLLVATSVIEVGIDVPNATVMVIEHAERFGLSQLHQLRGRVGRGSEDSWCVLISEAGEVAADRLKVFRDTNDGFALARADLEIRGPGDVFGAQQHGHEVVLRHADLSKDEELLIEAQRRARAVVEADPELTLPPHAGIRHTLEARYAERLRLFDVG